jgi:molybdenum cofactor biosynthesis enzyme MoaA
MSCAFCYLPFDGAETNLELWQRIVSRLHEVGVSAVTFGGGDPFRYKDFINLLTFARERIPFVHVDTNGYGLRRSKLGQFTALVDLLGLPLDGSTAAIHGVMRDDARHFTVVVELARAARELGISTKINTVVGKDNQQDLSAMAALVRSLQPQIWSIYQFWELGIAGSENAGRYKIDASSFQGAVTPLRGLDWSETDIEIGDVSERKNVYFFVSNTGRCYTIDQIEQTKYQELGSIFDDQVFVRWSDLGYATANEARLKRRVSELQARTNHDHRD